MSNSYDLRSYQEDALDSIRDCSGPNKSLVMPTGSGKTRVALYYAQQLIDEGKSVAYIAKTEAHAEQVLREAELIGTDVAYIPGKQSLDDESEIEERQWDIDDYNIGIHTGVFSYSGYFLGSGVPRAEHLIIDDAHAVVSQDISLGAVELNRSEWGRRYNDLLDLIKETNPLLEDHINGLQHPVHREGDAVLVPPPKNEEAVEAIRERVSTLSDGTGYHKYLLRQRLDANPEFINWPCVVTSDSICWRPFVLPFEASGQPPHNNIEEEELLLLTSTTESEEFLQYRLGLSSNVNQAQLAEEPPEMGSRIVIPYPDLGAYSPPNESQLNIIEQWAEEFGSVLVSVSSDAAYARLAAGLNSNISTHRYQSDQSIDDFESLQEPRVLTLVNQPSGIDIRSSVCKVGIHLDLPYSTSGHEAIAGDVESSGNVADASLAVRLSQLLGRLNRDPDDKSVHLILAGDLPLTRGSIFVRSLDPAVLLDILIGKRGIKRDYRLPDDDELIEEVGDFFNGDDDLRERYRERQETARERYLQGSTNDFSPSPDQVVEANLYSARGNFTEAARMFESLARNADSEGFNAEASYFDFQGVCCGLVDDVDLREIYGRDVSSLIDQALQRNPPSNALVAALRQAQPDTDSGSDESQRQLTEMRLRQEGFMHYQYNIEEFEDDIQGSDLTDIEVWRDYWRNRLTSSDHEELLDSYIRVFQLLGTDTPHREIENNDAKVQWETQPGEIFTVALETKGWGEDQRDTPSELKVDHIIQARDNAENIDADGVLLVSSREGYERDVPTEAENREVAWFDKPTALAIADLIAEQCVTFHRITERATGQDEIPHDALIFSTIIKENPGGEVIPGDIRSELTID
ncbi:DEAD/DEAH box helicase family protein [Haloarcula sp. CGMCC 1.2071]|uniref:DEAD/DEAH box helicase family protein n=1 Tax=Haloarcula sp. CGMCC 1.2071 TaxID=3111454 RepID=UPI00300F519B